MNITRGVRPSEGHVTASGAAERVTLVAERAQRSGTFGVGGLLIGKNGKVYAESINAVIQNGIQVDPTGHAERQLVDWYFQAKDRLKLPPPSELLIVSSLDPCTMCAGSILKSGFTAVAVAEEQRGGVHENGLPHRMPHELWELAEARLGLFSVHSHYESFFPIRSPAERSELLGYIDTLIGRCEKAIVESEEHIRSIVRKEFDSWTQKEDLKALLKEFRKELPDGIELPPEDIRTVTGVSRKTLAEMLRDNRTALIDQEGRPILVARSAEELSPIRSSIMEAVRGYTHTRNAIYDSYGIFLPPHRHLSLVKHNAPETPLEALFQLGSLGNFLGRDFESKFALLNFLEGSEADMQRFMSTFPPVYQKHSRFSAKILPN